MKPTSALVFGFNGNDPKQTLNLAESDSRSVREVLGKLGFWIPDQAMQIGEKATFEELQKAAKVLSKERPVGLLFFFAGHGTLIRGRNHIELADGLYSLEQVRDAILEDLPGVRRLIMIIDACRLVLGSPPTGAGFSSEAVIRSDGRQAETRSGSRATVRSHPDTAYMFGCNWGESSVEIRGAQRGIFTGAFISEIEQSDPSDTLVLRTLAARLKMDGDQQAAVIDGHGLALRTLGELPATPPDTEVGEPVDYLACSGQRALCLTVSGRLEVSESGQDWVLVGGAPFRSAGLAGPLFFAHAETFLRIRVNTRRRKTSVDSTVGHFVSSPEGKWLAGVPVLNSGCRTMLYSSDDASEAADEIPVDAVQHLAFLDDYGTRLLMIDAGGKVILYDRLDRRSSRLMGRTQTAHPARLAAAPDGKWAAWCDWSGRLWIWDDENDTIEELPPFAAPVIALVFASNGMIAAGLANGTVMLRQAPKARFKPLPGILVEGLVTALAFTQCDNVLILGTSRGSVCSIPLRRQLHYAGDK